MTSLRATPHEKLDPRDGRAEGSIVLLHDGERVVQPLHRVTEIRGPGVALTLTVESATKVIVAVTQGSVLVRSQRVRPDAAVSVMPREPFFIDGVMTQVEITSFQPSSRPPIVVGNGKRTIVGAFVISGTPIDFIERETKRHELAARGSLLVVSGRVQHKGARERVDTFPDQTQLDLSYLWNLARAETIHGRDKAPLYVADDASHTRLALAFDLGAGTLMLVGECDVATN